MKFQLTAKVEDDGKLTLNGVYTYVTGRAPVDFRASSIPGIPYIFRRDILRKRAKEIGISLPRGAKPGTEWVVDVETELWGAMTSGDVDPEVTFDEADVYDRGFFIRWPGDDRIEIEVTEISLG